MSIVNEWAEALPWQISWQSTVCWIIAPFLVAGLYLAVSRFSAKMRGLFPPDFEDCFNTFGISVLVSIIIVAVIAGVDTTRKASVIKKDEQLQVLRRAFIRHNRADRQYLEYFGKIQDNVLKTPPDVCVDCLHVGDPIDYQSIYRLFGMVVKEQYFPDGDNEGEYHVLLYSSEKDRFGFITVGAWKNAEYDPIYRALPEAERGKYALVLYNDIEWFRFNEGSSFFTGLDCYDKGINTGFRDWCVVFFKTLEKERFK